MKEGFELEDDGVGVSHRCRRVETWRKGSKTAGVGLYLFFLFVLISITVTIRRTSNEPAWSTLCTCTLEMSSCSSSIHCRGVECLLATRLQRYPRRTSLLYSAHDGLEGKNSVPASWGKKERVKFQRPCWSWPGRWSQIGNVYAIVTFTRVLLITITPSAFTIDIHYNPRPMISV